MDKNSLCKKCELKLKKYEIAEIINYSCNSKYNFDYAIFLFRYESIVRETIIKYKFNEQSYLYKTFAEIILNNYKICSFLKKYDIIIPVPLYIDKFNKRGYNQTELIARVLARELRIKIDTKILKKVKNTAVQSTLKGKERVKNIKDAFEVTENQILKGKKVILFDDIYTTGSTANECARVLKKAGTETILVLTLARD